MAKNSNMHSEAANANRSQVPGILIPIKSRSTGFWRDRLEATPYARPAGPEILRKINIICGVNPATEAVISISLRSGSLSVVPALVSEPAIETGTRISEWVI